MAGTQKKGKKPNNSPSRARYWANRTLEKRKVRNLVKYNGMDPVKALSFWRKVRKGRLKWL